MVAWLLVGSVMHWCVASVMAVPFVDSCYLMFRLVGGAVLYGAGPVRTLVSCTPSKLECRLLILQDICLFNGRIENRYRGTGCPGHHA